MGGTGAQALRGGGLSAPGRTRRRGCARGAPARGSAVARSRGRGRPPPGHSRGAARAMAPPARRVDLAAAPEAAGGWRRGGGLRVGSPLLFRQRLVPGRAAPAGCRAGGPAPASGGGWLHVGTGQGGEGPELHFCQRRGPEFLLSCGYFTRVSRGRAALQWLASKSSPPTWMRESIIKSTAVISSSLRSSSRFKGREQGVRWCREGAQWGLGGGGGAVHITAVTRGAQAPHTSWSSPLIPPPKKKIK